MTGNRLLDSLGDAEGRALEPLLTERALKVGETIYERFERTTSVYFPIDCVLSMIATMNDGDEIEVGTIGFEGFSAPEALLGATESPTLLVSQVPGNALVLPFDAFTAYLESSEAFRTLAQRYARYAIALTSQCVACNRLHPLLPRAARWLLTTHDRVKSDTFQLTQEYFAVLLGVHRQAVNVAATTLQEAGYISYARGSIVIRDRAGLQSVSCECYAATSDALERLWPASLV